MQLHEPLPLQAALVAAAQRLGIGPVLLRMVAAELPDGPWASLPLVHGSDGEVVAVGPHLCDGSCRGSADCLTALKAEALVSRRQGRPYALAAVRPVGRDLEVHLRPWPW